MAAISTGPAGRIMSHRVRLFAFWFAYAAFLTASIPNVAWFIAAFSDGSSSAWVVAYHIALVIEATIYITALTIYAFLKWPNSVLKWFAIASFVVVNICCTSFSFIANWAHATHYENHQMLTGTQAVPIASLFPIIVALWPVFGVIFSIASRVITESKPADLFEGMSAAQIEQWYEDEAAKTIARGNIEQLRNSIRGQNAGLRIGLAWNTFRGVAQGARVGATNGYTPPQLLPAHSKEDVIPFPKHQTHVTEEVPSPELMAQAVQTAPEKKRKPFPELDDVLPILDVKASQSTPEGIQAQKVNGKEDNSDIITVMAIDVGYTSKVGTFILNGVTFARFDKAFQTFRHKKLDKAELDLIWRNRLIDTKYFRYVQVNSMIKTRCIVDAQPIFQLCIEAIKQHG